MLQIRSVQLNPYNFTNQPLVLSFVYPDTSSLPNSGLGQVGGYIRFGTTIYNATILDNQRIEINGLPYSINKGDNFVITLSSSVIYYYIKWNTKGNTNSNYHSFCRVTSNSHQWFYSFTNCVSLYFHIPRRTYWTYRTYR